MNAVELNLPYKGDRDYLHGTDIYAETVRIINGINPEVLNGKCRLAIHRIARRPCRLLFSLSGETIKRPDNLVAEFSFTSNADHLMAWIVETSGVVTRRIPYPESQIAEKCDITGSNVRLTCATGFSPIEELVAMTKFLHMEKYPPAESKWYFTRLDLERLLTMNDAGKLQLRLIRNFNNRLTQSEVASYGKTIGHIYFSMV